MKKLTLVKNNNYDNKKPPLSQLILIIRKDQVRG